MADAARGCAATGRPMPSLGQWLALAQFGDSAFPSGASAFSWGLESLLADDQLRGEAALQDLLHAMVAQRWAGLERPLARAAYDAAACDDDRALIAVDQRCHAVTLGEGARAASLRLGFTQLRVHAELGLAAAERYLAHVRTGAHAGLTVHGHLPVALGLVWRAAGLPLREAEALCALGQCMAVTGAAIRLGRLGHVQAQRLLTAARAYIETVLDDEPPALDMLWSGAPALDIAAMRHETRAARLFAN